MSEIFLSYARKDRDKAQALAKILGREKWSVWWDPKILVGDNYEDVITQALNSARCIIVLWSRHSVSSDWVRYEAEKGKERGILIPVLIEQVEQPIGFRRLHKADLSNWVESQPHSELENVLNAVAEKLGKPRVPTKISDPSPQNEHTDLIETGEVARPWSADILSQDKRKRTIQVNLSRDSHKIEYTVPIVDTVNPLILKVDGKIIIRKTDDLPTRISFNLTDGSTQYTAVIEAETRGLNVINKFRLIVANRVLYSKGYEDESRQEAYKER